MRFALGGLIITLGLLQASLWFGERGLPGVWQRQAELDQLQDTAERFSERNQRLEAEVRDLRQGGEAIVERARKDLGMVRGDEVFIRMVRPDNASGPAPKEGAATP